MKSIIENFQTKLGWPILRNFWAFNEIKLTNPKKFSSKPKFLKLLSVPWLLPLFSLAIPNWKVEEGGKYWLGNDRDTFSVLTLVSSLFDTEKSDSYCFLPLTSPILSRSFSLSAVALNFLRSVSMVIILLSLWGICVCSIVEHSQNLNKSSTGGFQFKSASIWGLLLRASIFLVTEGSKVSRHDDCHLKKPAICL